MVNTTKAVLVILVVNSNVWIILACIHALDAAKKKKNREVNIDT